MKFETPYYRRRSARLDEQSKRRALRAARESEKHGTAGARIAYETAAALGAYARAARAGRTRP